MIGNSNKGKYVKYRVSQKYCFVLGGLWTQIPWHQTPLKFCKKIAMTIFILFIEEKTVQ